MGLNNDIARAAKRFLEPLKTAGDDYVAAADVVIADGKFLRFLAGQGGPFGLPLVAVGYAGTKKHGSNDRSMLSFAGFKHLQVVVVVSADSGVPVDVEQMQNLINAAEDLLAGRRVRQVDGNGDWITADGDVTTDEKAAEQIAYPLEPIGDEPLPLPADAAALAAWVDEYRCRVQWVPNRPADTDPDQFEQITGAIGPVDDDTQTEITPDDDVDADAFDIRFDDAPDDDGE